MKFNDLVNRYNLKIKATSNLKIRKILLCLLLNGVKIYLRKCPFSNDIGIVNLLHYKGTRWVCYIKKNIIFIHMVVLPFKTYLNLI